MKKKNSTRKLWSARCYPVEIHKYFCAYFTTIGKELSMYGYTCKKCGCTLDPGEGRLCDDCREEMNEEQNRKKEVDRMVRCTDYEQMEMEEFLR